jgi:amidase
VLVQRARADEDRHKLRAEWAHYFTSHDLLITLATPTAAIDDQTSTPAADRYISVDGTKRDFYDQTSWVNLASPVGLPAIVMPAGRTKDGLPLAIQIIGPYRTVVAAAKALAKVLPAHVAPPAFNA